MVKFQTGPLFDQTWRSRSENNASLKNKLSQFVQVKSQEPTASFGSSDKPFKSGGFFTNAIPKLRHAHLTHDLSLVYALEGGADPVIRLYGVFSHDDLGTGNPPNKNRQRSMASQLAGQTFAGQLGPLSKSVEPAAQPKIGTARPDYTPRSTPASMSPKSTVTLSQSVAAADRAWPQRNLARQFDSAGSQQERLALINRELAYLEAIVKKHQLYPNQAQYAKQVIGLFKSITAAR
jgi:hypothetical protein